MGETVIFTDAEGNRYTYKITALRNEKHADQEALQRVDAPLTLFIKNIYSFEYLMTTGLRISSATMLGRAIRPLRVSEMSHIRVPEPVAPTMQTRMKMIL